MEAAATTTAAFAGCSSSGCGGESNPFSTTAAPEVADGWASSVHQHGAVYLQIVQPFTYVPIGARGLLSYGGFHNTHYFKQFPVNMGIFQLI